MRLAFLGSPQLAVPVLDALVAADHDVALVVSRPDRRRGRGGATTPTPVKAAALASGMRVTDRLADLGEIDVELSIVVAYGALVPAPLLDRSPMLNVHLSLLPRWRGAAPVERAILAGDERAGVCVMRLEATLDTGPVYASASTDVSNKQLDALQAELIDLGVDALLPLLSGSVADLPTPTPQRGEATYAHKVTDDEYELDFSLPAIQLTRVVRLGRARTSIDGDRLGVREVELVEDAVGEPGTLHDDVVACGEGGLRLRSVVPSGRREMPFGAWRRGRRVPLPTHLGDVTLP
jgi:methionyl-tRNA formyltransferase